MSAELASVHSKIRDGTFSSMSLAHVSQYGSFGSVPLASENNKLRPISTVIPSF